MHTYECIRKRAGEFYKSTERIIAFKVNLFFFFIIEYLFKIYSGVEHLNVERTL